jgi:hypothetical protein
MSPLPIPRWPLAVRRPRVNCGLYRGALQLRRINVVAWHGPPRVLLLAIMTLEICHAVTDGNLGERSPTCGSARTRPRKPAATAPSSGVEFLHRLQRGSDEMPLPSPRPDRPSDVHDQHSTSVSLHRAFTAGVVGLPCPSSEWRGGSPGSDFCRSKPLSYRNPSRVINPRRSATFKLRQRFQ